MPQWRWLIRHIVRRIWFRAAAIGVVSILLALSAGPLAPLVPWEITTKIDAETVDRILDILAASMLTVTTFSLTAMVAAFSGAATRGTPRATELLVEDSGAQNAISTFLGGFLFAIVGIIALALDWYGEQGRVILFFGTVVMIAWIAFTLMRWIGQLARFGRVKDTVERVEDKTKEAIVSYRGPTSNAARDIEEPPADATRIMARATGYVAHIDRKALSTIGKTLERDIHVAGWPGRFVDATQMVAWVEGDVPEDSAKDLAEAFSIAEHRDFDQDPRFGMVVLAEIASRALSPGINDPGTAIAALTSGQRVAEALMDRDSEACEILPFLVDAPLTLESMVQDLVQPVARDGAGLVEVGIQVQKTLASIAKRTDAPFARKMAQNALERAERTVDDPLDLERIRRAHRNGFATAD